MLCYNNFSLLDVWQVPFSCRLFEMSEPDDFAIPLVLFMYMENLQFYHKQCLKNYMFRTIVQSVSLNSEAGWLYGKYGR
jgi:hypothetical protein